MLTFAGATAQCTECSTTSTRSRPTRSESSTASRREGRVGSMDWSPDVAARRPQTAGNFGVREVRYDRRHSSWLADIFQGGTVAKKVNLDMGRWVSLHLNGKKDAHPLFRHIYPGLALALS